MENFMMIVALVVIAGIGVAAFFAFGFLGAAMPFVNKAFRFVTMPFQLLWAGLKSLVEMVIPVSLKHRASTFGGLGSLLMFLGSLVFVAVVCIKTVNHGDIADVLQLIIFNTTMGSFYTLFSDGFSFAPSFLVAVAFAGCLASTCMKSAKDVPLYIWLPYCIVFVAMSAILASYLVPVFDSVGNWGWETLRGLWENKGASFFPKVGRILALIGLGYLAIVCLVMVVREYYACLCFGPITLSAIMFVGIFMQLVTDYGDGGYNGRHWVDYLIMVMFFGSMILVEYLRERFEGDA